VSYLPHAERICSTRRIAALRTQSEVDAVAVSKGDTQQVADFLLIHRKSGVMKIGIVVDAMLAMVAAASAADLPHLTARLSNGLRRQDADWQDPDRELSLGVEQVASLPELPHHCAGPFGEGII